MAVGILSLAVGLLGPAISFAMTTSFAKFTALSGTIAFLNVASTALASVVCPPPPDTQSAKPVLCSAPAIARLPIREEAFGTLCSGERERRAPPRLQRTQSHAGQNRFRPDHPGAGQGAVRKGAHILETGLGFSNDEECLLNSSGAKTWYSSSKVALHDPHGRIIGLAGVTHNITARKRMEAELADSRDQLTSVLGGIADGIAMFDKDGVLVYCNDRYRQFFPLTAALRRPGISFGNCSKPPPPSTSKRIFRSDRKPSGSSGSWAASKCRANGK